MVIFHSYVSLPEGKRNHWNLHWAYNHHVKKRNDKEHLENALSRENNVSKEMDIKNKVQGEWVV